MPQRKCNSYHYHLLTVNDSKRDLAENVRTAGMAARGWWFFSVVTNIVRGTSEQQVALEVSPSFLGTPRDNVCVSGEVIPGGGFHIQYHCLR